MKTQKKAEESKQSLNMASLNNLEYENAVLKVENEASKIVQQMHTPLCSIHLSKGEVWQVMMHLGKLKEPVETTEKIPLMALLTDYIVTAILDPNLVDLFVGKNKVRNSKSYLNQLSRQWSIIFRTVIDYPSYFSPVCMEKLHAFLSSISKVLYYKDRDLHSCFQSYDCLCYYKSQRMNYPFEVRTGEMKPFQRQDIQMKEVNIGLANLEIGRDNYKNFGEFKMLANLNNGVCKIICSSYKMKEDIGTLALLPGNFDYGYLCLGGDQNLVFLYPTNDYCLGNQIKGYVYSKTSLFFVSSEQRRIVLFFKHNLNEEYCEQLNCAFNKLLNGRLVEVDQEFAGNLYKLKISHKKFSKGDKAKEEKPVPKTQTPIKDFFNSKPADGRKDVPYQGAKKSSVDARKRSKQFSFTRYKDERESEQYNSMIKDPRGRSVGGNSAALGSSNSADARRKDGRPGASICGNSLCPCSRSIEQQQRVSDYDSGSSDYSGFSFDSESSNLPTRY